MLTLSNAVLFFSPWPLFALIWPVNENELPSKSTLEQLDLLNSSHVTSKNRSQCCCYLQYLSSGHLTPVTLLLEKNDRIAVTLILSGA